MKGVVKILTPQFYIKKPPYQAIMNDKKNSPCIIKGLEYYGSTYSPTPMTSAWQSMLLMLMTQLPKRRGNGIICFISRTIFPVVLVF